MRNERHTEHDDVVADVDMTGESGAASQFHGAADEDARDELHVVADDRFTVDDGAGADVAARANAYAVANRRMRADFRGRVDGCARSNRCGWMHAGYERRIGMQQSGDTREGRVRVDGHENRDLRL